jgi:2'-5' RNA ligase
VSTAVIGVAVAIPEPWGSELEGWRDRLGDPQAHAIPAHITLLPPTRVAESDLAEVEAHLERAGASVPPYDVHLRGTGTFRPVSPVVFVALSQGISGCEQLQRAVRTGRLERDIDFPYHPHVTVAHDLPDEALDHAYGALSGFEARFTVSGFALYVHGGDGVWHVRRVFDLGPSAG